MIAPPSQDTCTLEGESNRGGGRNLTLGTSPPAGAFSACCCCTGFAAAPRGGAAAPPHHRPTASWAASAPPQRPARALAAPPRLHFAAAIHRCAAAPRLPGASVRRDEPPRLPPWLRRRPSRTARRDRSRVRGLTHLSRPRVRLSDPRLPFTRRHHRHGRRRPCGTRGTSRPPWRCWPLPRRRSYPPHRWCTASAAPLGASPVILPPPPPPPPV